jgi:hypothetical protein
MIVAVFRRRLKDGASFEGFIEAWEAERGFGVQARVFNAVSLDDPREILSVGFVDIDAAALGSAAQNVAAQEAVRHSRIDAGSSRPCYAHSSTFGRSTTSQRILARSNLAQRRVSSPRLTEAWARHSFSSAP